MLGSGLRAVDPPRMVPGEAASPSAGIPQGSDHVPLAEPSPGFFLITQVRSQHLLLKISGKESQPPGRWASREPLT